MRQPVSSACEWTSPVPFISICCPLLSKVLAYVRYQELLRIVGEKKSRNIFHSHQLNVEFISAATQSKYWMFNVLAMAMPI
jgi:hypothetical protein